MHCKSCLKKAQYFSTCMHPYCEGCYNKKQLYCESCESGVKRNKLLELFERFSLREYTPSYHGVKQWLCGY
jgi:hypothetical protein